MRNTEVHYETSVRPALMIIRMLRQIERRGKREDGKRRSARIRRYIRGRVARVRVIQLCKELVFFAVIFSRSSPRALRACNWKKSGIFKASKRS